MPPLLVADGSQQLPLLGNFRIGRGVPFLKNQDHASLFQDINCLTNTNDSHAEKTQCCPYFVKINSE